MPVHQVHQVLGRQSADAVSNTHFKFGELLGIPKNVAA